MKSVIIRENHSPWAFGVFHILQFGMFTHVVTLMSSLEKQFCLFRIKWYNVEVSGLPLVSS